MRHRSPRRTSRCAMPIFAPELQKARRGVPKIVAGWLATLVLTGLVGVFHADSAWARSGDAAGRTLRRPPAKPTRTALAQGEDGTRLHLKLAEGTGARRRNGRFVSSSGVAMSSVEDVLRAAGIGPSRIRSPVRAGRERSRCGEADRGEPQRTRAGRPEPLLRHRGASGRLDRSAVRRPERSAVGRAGGAGAASRARRPRTWRRRRRTIRVSRDTGSARR